MNPTEKPTDKSVPEDNPTPPSLRKPWQTPRVIFAEINSDTQSSLGPGSDGSIAPFLAS